MRPLSFSEMSLVSGGLTPGNSGYDSRMDPPVYEDPGSPPPSDPNPPAGSTGPAPYGSPTEPWPIDDQGVAALLEYNADLAAAFWADAASMTAYSSGGGGGGGGGGRGYDSTDDASGYFWNEMSTGDWDWAMSNYVAANESAIIHDMNAILQSATSTQAGLLGVISYLNDHGLGSLTKGTVDTSYNASNSYLGNNSSDIVVIGGGFQYIPQITNIVNTPNYGAFEISLASYSSVHNGGATYVTAGASADANQFADAHITLSSSDPHAAATYQRIHDGLAKVYDLAKWQIANPGVNVLNSFDIGKGLTSDANGLLHRLQITNYLITDTRFSGDTAVGVSSNTAFSGLVVINPGLQYSTGSYTGWATMYGLSAIDYARSIMGALGLTIPNNPAIVYH